VPVLQEMVESVVIYSLFPLAFSPLLRTETHCVQLPFEGTDCWSVGSFVPISTLFVPHSLLSWEKRYTLYTVIFIVTLLLCGAGEILFLCDDLREFIYYGYSLEEQHYFLFQDFLFVTMRDAGLLAVFVLLKQLEIVNDEYTDLQNEGIRRFRVVKVRDKDNKPLLLSMDDILYCEQKKNYTHFHTATGEYTALTSLKTISLQFGKECVQISRNTLVMQHAIEQEGDTFLILKESAYPDNLKELMVNERYRKENRRIPRS